MREGQKSKGIVINLIMIFFVLCVLLLGFHLIKRYNEESAFDYMVLSSHIFADDMAVTSVAGEASELKWEVGGVNMATDCTSQLQRQAEVIGLHRGNAGENRRFEAVNMFPGDSQTQYYKVGVTFRNMVTIRFSVKVREGYEKLGEVLNLSIRRAGADQILYEGAINGLVGSIDQVLLSDDGETTEELYYEVTAYLAADVSNEYQNKALLADFSWWVEETENLRDNPLTGEGDGALIWLALAIISLLSLLILTHAFKHGGKMGRMHSLVYSKLVKGIAFSVALALGLGITTFALGYEILSVNENLFETGEVNLNLNDGSPIIGGETLLFEPGMTVVKDFFLENLSTCDVYYKLYFDNVVGDDAGILKVTVKDSDRTLYSGMLSEMNRESMSAADDLLREGERRELTIIFHCPEDSGNDIQGIEVIFDMSADAVQAVHNPDRQFH